jgi:hypothetical protein
MSWNKYLTRMKPDQQQLDSAGINDELKGVSNCTLQFQQLVSSEHDETSDEG